jgi:CheY-like chemotaxis protein
MDILVVENDDECRIGVSKILMDRGHRVISGRNLEEARGVLGCLRFDVLVSDISLPDGSGLELMAEGGKRQGWNRAVALTAFMNPDEREQSLRAGFDEYLTKPVEGWPQTNPD